MTLSNTEKKHLRRIGHGLNPVVTIAGKGLSENVLAELDRALHDHELIKVKLATGDRRRKKTLCDDLCEASGAQLVQMIGHMALLYRKAAQPDPRLSNLLR